MPSKGLIPRGDKEVTAQKKKKAFKVSKLRITFLHFPEFLFYNVNVFFCDEFFTKRFKFPKHKMIYRYFDITFKPFAF